MCGEDLRARILRHGVMVDDSSGLVWWSCANGELRSLGKNRTLIDISTIELMAGTLPVD